MLPVKLILCPTDFSRPACACVRAASELAEHFGAELLLVNVVPALPAVPPDPHYVFKIPDDISTPMQKPISAKSAKNWSAKT
jgi:hypothetical protein